MNIFYLYEIRKLDKFYLDIMILFDITNMDRYILKT